MVRHSRLSPEHEALLPDLARELRVGRICGRAAGLYPATDLLVRYDLYGVSVFYRFDQRNILARTPSTLTLGCEERFTRAILRELSAASHPAKPTEVETDGWFTEMWNRNLHRGF